MYVYMARLLTRQPPTAPGAAPQVVYMAYYI